MSATRYPFRLSLDIRRYFPSISHELLCAILFRRLRDPRTRRLLEAVIDEGGRVYQTELARKAMGLDTDPLPAHHGMPIGSYVSQWCGALYLDGLDHFVKRELKVPAYLRYMDDLVLFSDSCSALTDARDAVSSWLAAERRLLVRDKGGGLQPSSSPSTFLGYRVSRAGTSPSPKIKRRMRRRLRAAASRGPDALKRSLRSYAGLLLF